MNPRTLDSTQYIKDDAYYAIHKTWLSVANQTFGLEVIEVVTMKRIDIGRASVDSNLVTLKLFQLVWRTYG